VRFAYTRSKNAEFHKISYKDNLFGSEDIYHYVETENVQAISINPNDIPPTYDITSFDTRADNIVWHYGASQYYRRINYNWNTGYLYTPDKTTIKLDLSFVEMEVFLKQGFNWSNVYGIHLSIRGTSTGTIYLSKVVKINDFKLSNTKQYLYGQFWSESDISKLPLVDTNEEFEINIVELEKEDVSTDLSTMGYIYNWDDTYLPFIDEKTYPDFISTTVNFDKDGFIILQTFKIGDASAPLDRAVLQYFNYGDDKIVPVTLSYILTYVSDGVTTSTRILNEINNFDPLRIGIPFDIDFNDANKIYPITVETHIEVDGKLMRRQIVANAAFPTQVLSYLSAVSTPNITHQEVTENITVNQNVINKPVETKIVKVYQPVFVEYIKESFKYERKNISFANLNQPAYMVISDSKNASKEGTILTTKNTSDYQIYFDLSELTPISKDTPYELYLTENDTKIGEGIITYE
jgi:hypothetical protein